MRNIAWRFVPVFFASACKADVGTNAECPTAADEFEDGSTDTASSTRRETGTLTVSSIGVGFTGFAQAHGTHALVTVPIPGEKLSVLYELPAGEYRVLFVGDEFDDEADWFELCDEQVVDLPADGDVFVQANPLTSWWYREENRCGAPYGQ